MQQPEIKQCVREAITMVKEAGYTKFNNNALQAFIEYQWQFDFDEPTKKGGDMVKAMKNNIFATRLVHRREGKADTHWQIKGTRDKHNQVVFEGRLDGGTLLGCASPKVIDMGKHLAEQNDSQRERIGKLKANKN